MQSDSDIKILTFTFQCKQKELDSSVTIGQLFKMEFKTFLCCGKKFYQVFWMINHNQILHPNEDDQISSYIKNGDKVKCYESDRKYSIWDKYRLRYRRATMLAGLNGPDFQTEFQEYTSINAEIANIIQETITN